MTLNGTSWNQSDWSDYLWDNHEEYDNHSTYGYECISDEESQSPCLLEPCGNAECVDLTQNGTIWNETVWAETLWDLYEIIDNSTTEGYECLLPCDFKPCQNNDTCIDLTLNGTSWNQSDWSDYLWDNHEEYDNHSTYGYECISDEILYSPCLDEPCGNATCIDLTQNGTVWNETIWAESLFDEFGIEDNSTSQGYECLLPCDFRPCDDLNATCIDLTQNGTLWSENHWEDYLLDNHKIDDFDGSNSTGYYCLIDEEDPRSPCEDLPCGNATCIDLTQNGTVSNFQTITYNCKITINYVDH